MPRRKSGTNQLIFLAHVLKFDNDKVDMTLSHSTKFGAYRQKLCTSEIVDSVSFGSKMLRYIRGERL